MGRKLLGLLAMVVMGSVACGGGERSDVAGVSGISSPLTGLCTTSFTQTALGSTDAAGVKLTASSTCAAGVPARHTFKAKHMTTGQSVDICSNQLGTTCLWQTKNLQAGWWEIELQASRDGGLTLDASATQVRRLGARCRDVDLTLDPGAPSLGQTATMQASATCDAGVTPEFRFTAQGPDGQVVLADWNSSSSASWGIGSVPGRYTAKVEVRQAGSPMADASTSQKLTLGPFCEIGATTAAAQDGMLAAQAHSLCFNGATPQYRFSQRDPAGRQVLLNDWADDANLDWDITGLEGTFRLITELRAAQSPALAPQKHTLMKALEDACTSVTLGDVPEAQMQGSTYELTASAGCSMPEYKFSIVPKFGSPSVICDWDSGGSCSWTSTDATPGQYTIKVEARRQGSLEIPQESDASATTLVDADEDGDGVRISQGDCHDLSSTIYPGAEEVCDGFDNNCADGIDENLTTTYAPDVDGDQHGSMAPDAQVQACQAPDGYVTSLDDCDDSDASIHPGAAEVCGNAIDENCDSIAPSCSQSDCGGEGQPACPCGGSGQPCCPSPEAACASPLDACQGPAGQQVCMPPCGGAGDPCCPWQGAECTDPILGCQLDEASGTSACLPTCGLDGMTCCDSSQYATACLGPSACYADSGLCGPCGQQGQPCCDDDPDGSCYDGESTCQPDATLGRSCQAP